ncbi:S8 family serine peptidase [Microbacterium hominis]|uniref:S8 family serine peptidase n=1 Tax=Microbacterium hominis TaxID=162426 RepID=A0A7D4PLH7_9MICO|nr:S8 family serine peptidase [Microbacterium hominis]QKJ18890.1 S8 family serine peptidase [Microbacterium hominis]
MANPTPPRSFRARASVCTAVSAVLVGALLVPTPALAAPALGADDVLNVTTPAERQALAAAIELTSPDEVHVADGVDLDAAEARAVVVVLRQPVAATARALASAQGETLSQADAEKAVKASQKRFEKHLGAQGVAKGITERYTSAINAVALSATGAQITALLDSPDVASVWPNEIFELNLPDAEGDGESGLTGGGVTYDEVAALHAAGITGEGVKIGVLDTGIDYHHPALADVYRGGYDAVDGDDDPMETTYADWKGSGRVEKVNGSPYYTSHGTHVAGIIAGQDDTFGGRTAWGVAPDAEIYGYRVLGPYGSGSTADILEGMDRALQDGMDVVNMSLGGSYNDHRSPLSVAADNLTLAGVTTVIAAGNDGDLGAATLGSPGTSALAITVGANDSPLKLATTTAAVGAASGDLRLISQQRAASSVSALAGKTYRLVDVGPGNSSGYIGKNPTGAIVLIQRGTATFTDMATYAKTRGAAGAIVVNNRPEGPIDVFLGESDSYAVMFGVDATQGAALRAALTAGATEVTFGTLGTVTTDADNLASFSSRGPANGTTDIKPEITAPGVSVMSSVPTWDIDPKATDFPYTDAYARKSGTSMATPFVAGLAGLMLGAEPTLAPADVKTRLMNTADDLNDASGVFESGAGQVDPRQAVRGTADAQVLDELWVPEHRGQTTVIDDITGALSLGMLPSTEASTVTRTVEITNRSTKSATYTLAIDTDNGAGTADFAASGAKVAFDKTVKVSAGSTKKVKVTLTLPAGAADGTYGAFITVAQSGEEALRLPLGFRVDDLELFDFTMLKPVMTTGTDVYDPALKFSAGVTTPTRTLDLFLVDAATGADIGYLGGIDPSLMKDGLRYGPFAWYGQYLPLTGDKNLPISHKAVTVEPGLHTLRVVATDDSGSTSERTADFYVDNTAPVFATNFGEGAITGADSVHEFTNGQSSFALSGTLIDGDVEAIRAAGIDIDQSDNRIQLFSATINPTKTISAAADGTFATPVNLLASPVQSHRFLGMDAAGNLGDRVETWWFRDTQPYVVGSADKKAARVGESVITSFSTSNAAQFATMRIEVLYNPRDAENIRVAAQEAFAEYGSLSGEPTITTVNASTSRWSQSIVFDGQSEYTGDGLPLVDIAYDVPATIAAENTGFLTVSTFVTNTAGRGIQMQRTFDTVQAIRPHGIAAGGFYAQGLFTPAGQPNSALDHSAVGAKATLTSSAGEVVGMTIGTDGALSNHAVPLSEDDWMLRVEIPGHLAWNQPLALSTMAADGKPAGAIVSFSAQLAAGDVNGDDVVDILDAVAIRDAKGTADRAADINADGTVDAVDLAFVELNFLARNHTADTVPTPKVKHKGVTLDQVLAAFAG